MKVLIGITQDLETAKSDLIHKFNKLGNTTEVGPFKTREEAESWKIFMMKRRRDYEEVALQAAPAEDALWFGFTVESPILH